MASANVRRLVAGAAALGLLLVCASSFADDDPEALIRQGVQLRRKGDEAKAHGYFQRAYDLARTPRSAAQLGLSDLAIKQWLPAEIHITEALDAPDPWVESIKASLMKSRAGARAHLGKIEIEGVPPDAEIEATDRPRTKLPASGALYFAPGPVHVRIQAVGFEPFTQDTAVEAGGTTRLRVAMARIETPPPPPEKKVPERRIATDDGAHAGGAGGHKDGGTIRITRHEPPKGDDGRPLRITGIAVASVGVAAGVTGFVLRSMATTKINNATSDNANNTPYNPANSNYQTLDRAGVGLMIGGGVALAGGVVAYILGLQQSPHEPTVAVSAGRDGAGVTGVTLTGRF
jgi:hypothetical protein